MSQVNPKELHPEVWKLFDRYVHGLIDRRGFLDGTAKYAVGGVTAVGIACAVLAGVIVGEMALVVGALLFPQ